MPKITWQVPGCKNVHEIPDGAIVTLAQETSDAYARLMFEDSSIVVLIAVQDHSISIESKNGKIKVLKDGQNLKIKQQSTFEYAGKRDQLLRNIANRVNELFKPEHDRDWSLGKLNDLAKDVDDLNALGYTFKV